MHSIDQATFRQDRSTEDQITYLTQEIEDASQEKKHTPAVWIDMEKTFDKVWKDGLKLKITPLLWSCWTQHAQVDGPVPEEQKRQSTDPTPPEQGA